MIIIIMYNLLTQISQTKRSCEGVISLAGSHITVCWFIQTTIVI